MNTDWIAGPGMEDEWVFPDGIDLIDSIEVGGNWVCLVFPTGLIDLAADG
jgi:hypothetical protein